MDVREQITDLRAVLGLTQEQFGKRIGIKKVAVSCYETGKVNPPLKTIVSICREFNVNETWLLTGMGDMFVEKFHSLQLEKEEKTVGARIRELRTVLDLSQQEFGKQIGINQVTVSCYETGKANPSTKAIASICREFNVNEIWFLTGKGEMFMPKLMESLNQLALKYQLLDTDYVIIERFLSLRPEIRREMFDYLYEIEYAAPRHISD